MRLAEVVGDLPEAVVHGDPATDVTSITHDSRAVRTGALFCCVPGSRADGHDHAPDAVRLGAAALLCERRLSLGVPEVEVPSVRAAMGPAAATLHGHPSRSMRVVGVTGTNGKTTTTHLLQAVLEAHGWRTGVIGTLTGTRTTPEAPELQADLATRLHDGAAAIAMEVSSHALALGRVDATWFAVAVFTNLSADHLDFHATMEEYYAAKAALFEPTRTALGVVNLDDAAGRRLAAEAPVPIVGFSLADAADLEVGLTSSTFRWHGRRVTLPLGGTFNVSNALAAATAARALDVPASTIAEGLRAAPAVPGRFEAVTAGQPFDVVVDYAHTPDGLAQLLAAARAAVGDGRVLVVFGCGGDRDRAKRPHMGEVAARLADVAYLTSDNPRSEDPLAIIDEVRAGMPSPPVVEPDRRAAIGMALEAAGPGDVVVVAGKGHETTQTVGDATLPFDDRAVVREELARLAGLQEGARW